MSAAATAVRAGMIASHASRAPWYLGGALLALLLLLAVGGFFAMTPSSSEQAGYEPSDRAIAGIPANYLELYQQAGAQYGIDWAILAAIGKVETDHGRLQAPGVTSGQNTHGCCAGPMQFHNDYGRGGGTWGSYGVDGNADGKINIYDPADAIPAAARYLKASGAPGNYERAIFAYNHANWYVADVLAVAQTYRGAPLGELPAGFAVGLAQANAVLANPRIQLTDVQRADLAAGGIDPRLIGVLAAIGERHTVLISSLQSDHSPGTNHEAGRAFDIAAVDGEICTGTLTGSCGRLVTQLAQVQGVTRSTELIYCFDADPTADTFARADHCNHIHVGFDQ